MTCLVTYDELARYTADDIDPDRAAEIEEHLKGCESCRRRVAALRSVDGLAGRAMPVPPPPDAMQRIRRVLAREVRGDDLPEVMTMEEVAEALRLSADEIDEIMPTLPAFEVAGSVRVRRSRLIEWIEKRERIYARRCIESEVAHILANEDMEGDGL